MSDKIQVTDADFQKMVLDADTPVLVDFYADWCMPCKMLGPTITELARKYEGRAKVYKVNVDKNPAVSSQYGVRSIPTVKVFNRGIDVETTVGVQPSDSYEQIIDKYLK